MNKTIRLLSNLWSVRVVEDTDPYTDTEAISVSLLFLLARSATHAEGVSLFCSLTTDHCSLSAADERDLISLK